MPVRSPHQIIGKLINTWFAQQKKIPANRIDSVLITNCTAAKGEVKRPEYAMNNSPDIDFVLTTRELARLIRLNGIDIHSLEAEPSDGPFHAVSSAGKLFAIAGGETEGTIRTIYREIAKKEMKESRLAKLRGNKAIREETISTPKGDISVVAVSGLKNAMKLLEEVKEGKRTYDFIEVMACAGGCVGGGGQPYGATDRLRAIRAQGLYSDDKSKELRFAHDNPYIKKLYDEFLERPLSEKSHKLLHTHYSPRPLYRK